MTKSTINGASFETDKEALTYEDVLSFIKVQSGITVVWSSKLAGYRIGGTLYHKSATVLVTPLLRVEAVWTNDA